MRLRLLGLLAGALVVLAGLGVDAASARGHRSFVAVVSKSPLVSFACDLLPGVGHDHAAASPTAQAASAATHAGAGHASRHGVAHVDAGAAPSAEHAAHDAAAVSPVAGTEAPHSHEQSSQPNSPTPTAPGATHEHAQTAGTCQPTPEQYNAAMKLVADTRAGISPRFKDFKTAVESGYRPNAGAAAGPGAAGHYMSADERADPRVLDPNHVESLIYGHTDRHGWVLIGAMYMMPKPGMHGPEIGGCMTQWHDHFEWAGPYAMPEMLHVWIVDMPGGPFTAEPDANYIRNL